MTPGHSAALTAEECEGIWGLQVWISFRTYIFVHGVFTIIIHHPSISSSSKVAQSSNQWQKDRN